MERRPSGSKSIAFSTKWRDAEDLQPRRFEQEGFCRNKGDLQGRRVRLNAVMEMSFVHEYPILFSGPMVQAIMDGKKTQTRRVITPQPKGKPIYDRSKATSYDRWISLDAMGRMIWSSACPFGQREDTLWVRETWLNNALPGYPPVYFYRADDEEKPHDRKWRPSIFMPKAACRIMLEVISVRIERLQDIGGGDLYREGISEKLNMKDAGAVFPLLWDKINKKRGYAWNFNPWVWVINFHKK